MHSRSWNRNLICFELTIDIVSYLATTKNATKKNRHHATASHIKKPDIYLQLIELQKTFHSSQITLIAAWPTNFFNTSALGCKDPDESICDNKVSICTNTRSNSDIVRVPDNNYCIYNISVSRGRWIEDEPTPKMLAQVSRLWQPHWMALCWSGQDSNSGPSNALELG